MRPRLRRSLFAACIALAGCGPAQITGTGPMIPVTTDPGLCDLGECGCGVCPDMRPMDAPPRGVHLAIPAYFYNAAIWATAIAAAPTVSVLVVNPSDGPGKAIDPHFTSVIGQGQARGIRVIGYVNTKYGARAAADVITEINRYYDFYKPSGIFLDEGPGSSTCGALYATYRSFAAAARARDPKAYLAINPGAGTCESYLGMFDSIVLTETTASNYMKYAPPAWTLRYDRDRFWHLVYGVSPAAGPGLVRLAAERRAGLVYVTSETTPNPWNALPAWLPDEIAAAVAAP